MSEKDKNTGVSFGLALNALKQGSKVKRLGWNGKGQYVCVIEPREGSHITEPFIVLRNAQGGIIPWLPSQGDLFADDWVTLL